MAETSSAAAARKRGRRARDQPSMRYREATPDPEIYLGEDPVPDLEDHPLISFAASSPQYAYLRRIISLEQHQPRSIDWRLMEDLDLRGRLEELLDARWRQVLAAEGPQFHVLTLEFFSTLEHRTGALDDPQSLVFSLGRQLHHMSLSEFAVRMGLYSVEEVTQPIFTESLRGVFRTESHVGVTAVQLAEFWTTIADGNFQSSTPASQIRDPLLRFLHRVIACTIIGRFMGIEKVNSLDLFILYCLVERRPANLATIMLSSLTRQRGRGEHSRLAMGCYIARLAANLGVLDAWPSRSLHPGPTVSRITYTDMQQMGVCPLYGPRRLVDARDPQPIPFPPGAQPEEIRPISQRFPVQPRQRAQPRAGHSSSVTLESLMDHQHEIMGQQHELRDAFGLMREEQVAQRTELAAQRDLMERMFAHLQFQRPPQ